MTSWFKARFGRMRVSTIVLLVVFVALFWVNQTFQPEPPPPAPSPAVVPPGFVPDPNYTWVPRTNVRRPKETFESTTATTTTTTPTTTSPTDTTGPTSPTSPTETTPTTPTTTVVDPDGSGPLPPTTQTIVTPTQVSPAAPGPRPATTAPQS
ncbi:hypothetical protein [Mycolicibacterium gadium]|uniref:hypothetical protein n=1 Tax=Mycolicibacterium gadium TaxID=1794 RepID=UPI0014785D27|nr:hypothetical protein [Mycolicibacterium gadium]